MGKLNWLACTSLTAVVVLAGPAAFAAAGGPSNAELEQRIEKLEQQQPKADQSLRSRVSVLEGRADEVQWRFDNGRPRVTSGDGRFELALRARFHFDAASFEQDPFPAGTQVPAAVRDLSSGAVTRRAQFGVEGFVFNDWLYEIRFNFGGSDTESAAEAVNLMRLSYRGIPNFKINAGIIQPILTAEDTTSSNDITFMERADIVNAVLDPFGGSDARRGIELTYQRENLFYPGSNLVISGAYTGQRVGTFAAGTDTDEGTYALGRIAYRLWSDGTSNVQVGASASQILSLTGATAPGGARTVQIRERPSMRVDGNRLVDTGAINARGGSFYGFDAGLNIQNFYLAGEWYEMTVERDIPGVGANPADAEFGGWYVAGSWILTGQNKTYAASSNGNGVAAFGAPVVVTPFSLKGGSWGALELAARYSELDLNHNEGVLGAANPGGANPGIRGGQQDVWTIGLNWYVNRNVRVMVNYNMVEVDRIATAAPFSQAGQDLDIIGGRLQFAF